MNKELKIIQRHNRIIWAVLVFLIILTAAGIFLNWKYRPAPVTRIENLAGTKGDSGQQGLQGVAGYTPIKGIDYTDGSPGVPGPGPTDAQIAAAVSVYLEANPPASGQQGIQGEPGTDGQTPEFECLNGDFVTKYPADDGWRVLQKDSKACRK